MGAAYAFAGVLIGLMAGRISFAEPGWAWLIAPAALSLLLAAALDEVG